MPGYVKIIINIINSMRLIGIKVEYVAWIYSYQEKGRERPDEPSATWKPQVPIPAGKPER